MNMSPDKSVQRAATRAPLGKPIRLQSDDSMEVIEGICMNISIGGMFIQVGEARPQGTLLRFELPLEDGASVRGLGEVVWMRSKSAGPGSEPGIGIKFRFLEQRDRQLIYKLVSQYIKERLSKRSAVQGAAPQPAVRSEAVFRPPDPSPPSPAGPSAPAEGSRPPLPSPQDAPRDASGQGSGGLEGFDPPTPLSPAELSTGPGAGGGEERPPAFDPQGGPGSSPATVSEGAPGGRAGTAAPSDAWDASEYDEADDYQPYRGQGGGVARRRVPSPGLLIGLGVMVVLLVLAFLFRDQLFGGGYDGEDGAGDTPSEVEATGATPGGPEATGGGGDGSAPVPEPGTPGAGTTSGVDDDDAGRSGSTAGDPAGATTDPTPASPPRPAAQTAARSGYTRITDITWSKTDDGLRLVFEGDGPITERNYKYFRLDGDPAREVIQFQGISEPFEPTRLDVGGPGVEQIRTGFHRKRGGGNELHVVMDMTSRGARVVEKRSVGFSLEILVSDGSDR